MADGAVTDDDVPPPSELAEATLLFKLASHPTRLRVLLILAGGERDSSQLAAVMGESAGGDVSWNLGPLRERSLISRRSEGKQYVYALTETGARVVKAYEALYRPLSVTSETTAAPVTERPRRSDRSSNARPFSPQLLSAAMLLNHAAHPLRLQILLSLAEEEQDTASLTRDINGVSLGRISQQVGVLRTGTLVALRHRGRQNYYTLTEAGFALANVVRATCSRLAITRGSLTLLPEPIKSGSVEALDPTSPEGLACLLKIFADPLRLRTLNLLAVSGGVCICHLHEALKLSRQGVQMSLNHPMTVGLILEEQEGRWLRYRLARPASDLHRSLVNSFGSRLADTNYFQEDLSRLESLSPCTVRLAAEPPDLLPHRRSEAATRTA